MAHTGSQGYLGTYIYGIISRGYGSISGLKGSLVASGARYRGELSIEHPKRPYLRSWMDLFGLSPNLRNPKP